MIDSNQNDWQIFLFERNNVLKLHTHRRQKQVKKNSFRKYINIVIENPSIFSYKLGNFTYDVLNTLLPRLAIK